MYCIGAILLLSLILCLIPFLKRYRINKINKGEGNKKVFNQYCREELFFCCKTMKVYLLDSCLSNVKGNILDTVDTANFEKIPVQLVSVKNSFFVLKVRENFSTVFVVKEKMDNYVVCNSSLLGDYKIYSTNLKVGDIFEGTISLKSFHICSIGLIPRANMLFHIKYLLLTYIKWEGVIFTPFYHYAFFTNSDFSPIAPIPSILQSILWSEFEFSLMFLTLVPIFTTPPLNLRSLITMTVSPSLRIFPFASCISSFWLSDAFHSWAHSGHTYPLISS